MTSLIFAVIMAISPAGEAEDAQLIAAKPDNAVEQPLVEPKIHEPEKAVKNFQHLLKKGKLTLPGIVIDESSRKQD
jgi:hypothetical protein